MCCNEGVLTLCWRVLSNQELNKEKDNNCVQLTDAGFYCEHTRVYYFMSSVRPAWELFHGLAHLIALVVLCHATQAM